MKKFILSIILAILLVASPTSAEFFSDVIVTSPNGIWTDSRAYATLQAAITAVGANDREIVIANEQTAANLTIPANVRLKFLRNGSISNSGYLVIGSKDISAGNRQIFTGVGNIDFVDGSVVKSGWFQNIESAFALTVNDSVTLIISNSATITASYSPGNNVTLRWEAPGNILTANAGVEVGNIKDIEAGNYQLFAGAGDFDFLDGTVLNLSWFRRLRSVVGWVEGEDVTLVVDHSSIVSYDNIIPANLSVKFVNGGMFNIDGGRTVTINGPLEAGLYQVFAGAGDVVLGAGSMNGFQDLWFGNAASNTAFGVNALISNTTGLTNQVIGANAFSANTTGSGNQVMGTNALSIRESVIYAVAIGENAMQYAVESATYGPEAYRGGGGWSVAIGKDAARGDPATDYCAEGFVAVGEGALMHQTTGSANTAVGSLAAQSNTTGSGIVAIGSLALISNVNGDDNVAVGGSALYDNISGSHNIGIGTNALQHQTIADNNTGVGMDALRNNVTGDNNTAIGYLALSENTVSNNTALGYFAGHNTAVGIATNHSMTYVGANATSTQGALSNSTAIGNGAQVYASNKTQFGNTDVISIGVGNNTITFASGTPLANFIISHMGDVVSNSAAVIGDPVGWICTRGGNEGLGGANELTAATTGSPTVTVTNPGGQYRVGYIVRATAQWAVLTELRIIAVTTTTITLDRNANGTGAVTIFRDDPTWVALANLNLDLTGAILWNPGNLVDGAGETSALITVTGAVLGDYVLVGAPYDLQDCIATGYVQAANKVEIRLQNESAGARDLANDTWKVRVIK